MSRMQMIVHLEGGGEIVGTPSEVVDEELAEAKKKIADMLGGGGGWQVNLESADSWFVVPKHAVLALELRMIP